MFLDFYIILYTLGLSFANIYAFRRFINIEKNSGITIRLTGDVSEYVTGFINLF